jgi:hypothetical protein
MKFRALLFGLAIAAPAYAQPAVPTGYDQLVIAGKLILPGENGSSSAAPTNLEPDENLRRQRAAVARNAPALKAVREALKVPIVMPPLSTEQDMGLANFGKFRELARQFHQESSVRAANGDWVGALDSRLTILEMGTAIMQGAPYLGTIIATAINAVGLKDIDKIAAHLDAASSREALKRLVALEASRPSFVEVAKAEKKMSLVLFARSMKDMATHPANDEWRKKLATPEGRARAKVTEAEAVELLATTPETMMADLTKGFDAVIERHRLPYPEAKKSILPPAKQAFTIFPSHLQGNPERFVYERSVVNQRLFAAALKLHIIKAETGTYPEKFEAPLDPFGNGTNLVYRRAGDKYLLYSVGPDGVDDGGDGLQAVAINPETGAKEVTDSLQSDSVGDVRASIF